MHAMLLPQVNEFDVIPRNALSPPRRPVCRRSGADQRRAGPSVRDVVEAILTPYVNMPREEPRAVLRWIKVFNQLALTEDRIWTDEFGVDPSFRYVRATPSTSEGAEVT